MKPPDLVDQNGRPLIKEEFSYAALDRETEAAARADAVFIKGRTRRTAADIVEIGYALLRQNSQLEHGVFLSWISVELDMTERTARKIMRAAARFGGRSAVAGLSAKALYELAASSTPEQVHGEVERRLANGELVAASEVKRLKAQAEEADRSVGDLFARGGAIEVDDKDLAENIASSEGNFGHTEEQSVKVDEQFPKVLGQLVEPSRANEKVDELNVVELCRAVAAQDENGTSNARRELAEVANKNYKEALARAHAIIHQRLFGSNPWMVDRDTGGALQRTLTDLGLDELVPGTTDTWRFTALGRLINAELLEVFYGAARYMGNSRDLGRERTHGRSASRSDPSPTAQGI